jgi:hypothetical protein
MVRHLVTVCLPAFAAQAAPPPMAFPAPLDAIRVQTDVSYGASGTTRLAMDIYSPPAGADGRRPARVFFNRAVQPPVRSIVARAAKACPLKGDPAATVGGLNTVPPQFPPASAQDPMFAALKGRPDFSPRSCGSRECVTIGVHALSGRGSAW